MLVELWLEEGFLADFLVLAAVMKTRRIPAVAVVVVLQE
jgi:hypothetical protein